MMALDETSEDHQSYNSHPEGNMTGEAESDVRVEKGCDHQCEVSNTVSVKRLMEFSSCCFDREEELVSYLNKIFDVLLRQH